MTIEKGQPWGKPGGLPDTGVVVSTDREAALVVTEARRAGLPLPVIGLLGGDLCRTLGGTGDEGRLRSAEAMTFPVDLGSVLADGVHHLFVAHLVVRDAWWSDGFVAMNAQWLGRLNLGPRAHPNDGRLDTYRITLNKADLLEVRRRARMGAHLPHPRLREERSAAVQASLDAARPVHVDGFVVGRAKNVSVRLEPDALTVVV
ncbi:MAG: hypothetical protein QOG03_2524 [Actinomycetota bacterium]|jgi:hypothetical protein|nr:hypothetical protein [Actinomycetota bacterium]